MNVSNSNGLNVHCRNIAFFQRGASFLKKMLSHRKKFLDIKKTAESFTYRNFQTNNQQYEKRVFLSVFF